MDKLFKAAIDVMKNSYSPYSNFRVGASLLLNDGTIITGTNIENASYGLTNCAERSCLFTAYSQGYNKKDIKAFVVAGNTEAPISPCGACGQVMVELLNRNTPVYLINNKGDVLETSVEDLMPYAFREIEVV